jgi:hypothetical protein
MAEPAQREKEQQGCVKKQINAPIANLKSSLKLA